MKAYWIVIVLLLVPAVHAASFGCEIRLGSTCLANETLLIRLNTSELAEAPNNSHAQLANYTPAYNWSVCCWTESFRSLSNTCTGTDATPLLKLASTTNSHVQAASQTGYANDACLNVTVGNITCEYPNGACSAGYSGVVSMASSESADNNLTNAHVSSFAHYMRKVCCQIGGLNAPSVAWVNLTPINTTTRHDLLCNNGTVYDADGDTVTLHYNWIRNGKSELLLNLPMDYDSSSGVTHDISGYGNDGTVTRATFLPSGGHKGGAFAFDAAGPTAQISAGNDSELSVSSGLTVSLWLKLNSYGTYYATHPIRKYSSTTNANFNMYLFGNFSGNNDQGKITFYANRGGVWGPVSPSGASAYVMPLNTWKHFVWTYDSTQGGQLYVDGVSFGALTGSGLLAATTAGVLLGEGTFNGTIDEVMIWNRSLSAAEVKTLYDTDNRWLNTSELVRGETWNCSITPVDSTGLAGTTLYSNQTYVDGSKPTVPSLIYPLNHNNSVFERIVRFNWTDATEPDGDTITYHFNLSVAPGSCAIEDQLTGLSTSNYTSRELCTDQLYTWNVTACDDQEGCSSVSQTFNFTIASVLSIVLRDASVAFGNLAIGQSVTTEGRSPPPFLLENDGNVVANITARGDNAPLSSVGLGDSAYQFRVEQNETLSMNVSGSQTSFTPILSTFIAAIKQMNYTDGSDRVNIHLNITVPQNEPPGDKSGNITFRAQVAR